MKKALILHGWYQKPEDNWYPWLGHELEKKGYGVLVPPLPTMDTDLPDMEAQLYKIWEILKVEKDTAVIGHSLGCVLALRLAEKKIFHRMILVAGWDFDDLAKEHRSFWQNKINHEAIKQNVKEIFVFSSDNDPFITAFQAEEMSKRLNGKFILVKGAGHFSKELNKVTKIPEVLQVF